MIDTARAVYRYDGTTATIESATSGGLGGLIRASGVIRIKPSEILMHDEPADMPAALKARKTYRFVFRQDVMAAVASGLYDVRMEVRADNARALVP